FHPSQVASSCPARMTPWLKDANSFWLTVAPVTGWGLMAGGCGIGIPRCCMAPAGFAIPPRMPGSCCALAAVHGRHSKAIATVRARRFHIFRPPVTKDSVSVSGRDCLRAPTTAKVLHYRQLSVNCQRLRRVDGLDLNSFSPRL